MTERNAEQQLRYLRRMGIDVWQQRRPPLPEAQVVAEPVAEPVEFVAPATWDELAAVVANCQRCGLCTTRTQTVFGVGDKNSRLLVLGEAPGADEDRLGEPFVGRAGQLLDQMLKAMGWPREQVYIANLLKCRPPDNRDPRAEEVAACEPYLLRQLELVQPSVILALGRQAAQYLLNSKAPLAELRGCVQSYGPAATPLVVTYHPAYLLRAPREKARAWQDLKLALGVLAGGEA